MLQATSLGGGGRMKRSRLLSVGRLSIVRGWLNTSSPLAAEIYRPSKRFTLTFPSLPQTVLPELNKQSF